jgi:hypothetical protein
MFRDILASCRSVEEEATWSAVVVTEDLKEPKGENVVTEKVDVNTETTAQVQKKF